MYYKANFYPIFQQINSPYANISQKATFKNGSISPVEVGMYGSISSELPEKPEKL